MPSIMHMNNSSCSGCSVSKNPIDAENCYSNTRGFPPTMQKTSSSLNIPRYLTSKKTALTSPTDKSNQSLVTRLDTEIVPRTILISWGTAKGDALQFTGKILAGLEHLRV